MPSARLVYCDGSDGLEVAVDEIVGLADDDVVIHQHQHVVVIVADLNRILNPVDVVDDKLDEVDPGTVGVQIVSDRNCIGYTDFNLTVD